MTKAEAKRVADLEEGLQMARSMRWPEYAAPASMTRTEIDAAKIPGGVRYGSVQMVARGWFANAHGIGCVSFGCSDGIYHNRDGDTTTSQGMGRMYPTEAEAWRAIRCEMTERFAQTLANIDRKIAEVTP